ncbi:MAG: glutathione S-transferase [Nannocystis sp.]|jgi:glutathione S-transferase|nr:glutathione S-transferase [Nannocystis sp.]
MLTVHHLERSRSHRILWLLEELAIEYKLEIYQRDPKTMRAPPSLRALHPLGKAPLVTVDGLVLAESGAILEHLVERFGEGRLRPAAGSPEAVQYRYWLHYAEGSLMPPLLVRLITETLKKAPAPFFIRPLVRAIAGKIDAGFTSAELAAHSGFIEEALAKQPWFAGAAFSAADVQMSYPVMALVEGGRGGGAAMPNASAWLARIKARPAYQAAELRGGPNGSPG